MRRPKSHDFGYSRSAAPKSCTALADWAACAAPSITELQRLDCSGLGEGETGEGIRRVVEGLGVKLPVHADCQVLPVDTRVADDAEGFHGARTGQDVIGGRVAVEIELLGINLR